MIYKKFKKKKDLNVVTNILYNYKSLPDIDLAERYFDKSLIYDLVITLDVAALNMVLDSQILFDKAKDMGLEKNPAYTNLQKTVEFGRQSIQM